MARTSYRQALKDSLVLRAASDASDVERVAAFNGEIHGQGVAAMTRSLFLHHPHTNVEDLIFVEDEQSDRVVSSLCLIPWTWRYEGIDIPVGEMGIVGTLEGYRRHGLIREQVKRFKQRLRERGCLLSQIQGIPHFYRQFGYEYALPLEGGLRLELRHIPDPPQATFAFRPATADDLPALMQLYHEAAQELAIHAARDEAIWHYLLTRTAGTEMERETWIVEDADGQTAGYFCLPKEHFGDEQAVSEVSRLSFDAALAALDHVKGVAVERAKPGIRLNLPSGCTLMRLARSLEAHDLGTYAWQIHVPDVAALLRAIGPALERRIATSPFTGLTHDVRISLYRETVLLRFEAGKLGEVANLGFTEGEAILRCALSQFIPLVLGYRSLEESRAIHPDVIVAPAQQMLIDTLFPKTTAFIYTTY